MTTKRPNGARPGRKAAKKPVLRMIEGGRSSRRLVSCEDGFCGTRSSGDVPAISAPDDPLVRAFGGFEPTPAETNLAWARLAAATELALDFEIPGLGKAVRS